MADKRPTKLTEKSDAAFSRRDMLRAGSLAVAAVGTAAAALAPPPADAQTPPPAPGVLGGGSSGSNIFSVVETQYGKVQGMANAGIKCFRGIPYGASTGGKNRFMPPKKPAKWAGVRNCIGYGPVSPQTPSPITGDYSQMIMWDRHTACGGVNEDMLNLNVWTPGVNDNAKRAVMVSFHGGGWATGSGNGPMYDGAQLAKLADVVVVTVNHRLAALGYAHLTAAGAPSDFKHSGVAGVMDMVQSLQWVKDNIANFGGDPSRVMIFGQSGGGSKTSCLLATPAAKGLFHRAGVQSGSSLRFITEEQAQKSAEMLLKALNISKANMGDLQKLPWERILEAQSTLQGATFTPVMGGYLPHHPFDPGAPPESNDVPVIISTTLEDAALSLTNWEIDEAGLKAAVNQRYPGKADEILKMYRYQGPSKSPYLIQAQVFTDAGGRRSAITQAERKSAAGGAPAYMYIWEWVSPTFNGKLGAVHGLDVDASFNLYRNNPCGGGDPEGRRMAKMFATTWATFAKTGNPNNDLIPNWPKYDAATRATMIFDSHTRVENDPRSDMRKYWASQRA